MEITSLTIADEAPHGWEDGDKLLAVFDYQDAGYNLRRTHCEQMSSGLPLKADNAQCSRHVAFVPRT